MSGTHYEIENKYKKYKYKFM